MLDGINVAECLLARQRGAVLKHEPLGSPRALPGAERTRYVPKAVCICLSVMWYCSHVVSHGRDGHTSEETL